MRLCGILRRGETGKLVNKFYFIMSVYVAEFHSVFIAFPSFFSENEYGVPTKAVPIKMLLPLLLRSSPEWSNNQLTTEHSYSKTFSSYCIEKPVFVIHTSVIGWNHEVKRSYKLILSQVL